jgi:hypothetical protein
MVVVEELVVANFMFHSGICLKGLTESNELKMDFTADMRLALITSARQQTCYRVCSFDGGVWSDADTAQHERAAGEVSVTQRTVNSAKGGCQTPTAKEISCISSGFSAQWL